MFFQYPNNNFLHAHVSTLVKNALNNRVYRTQYARHLLVECDLLTRLMDVFEENQNNKGRARAGYMGHGVVVLAAAARALAAPDPLAHALRLAPPTQARWALFRDHTLRPLLHQLDTPLGGYYPSENIYEVEIMADTQAANYDFNDMVTAGTLYMPDDANADDANDVCGAVGSSAESADFIADGLGVDDEDKMTAAKSNFLELASQRFDDDMWDDSCEAEAGHDEDEHDLQDLHDLHDLHDRGPRALDVLQQHNPWEAVPAESGGAAGAAPEGWAQFSDDNVLGAQDPFAPQPAGGAPPTPPALADDEFSPFWSYTESQESGLEAGMRGLELGEAAAGPGAPRMDDACSVELANNLLTAMSAMSADAIANIVNANLTDAGPPS
ncbi:unnamed protein product [Spodoptera exigua]|nr:unnamed protein product [Spodoptera exigua]